ncbi:MAG: hypothetical protein CVU48_04440 [Candidatus Cloacimonetes bacterium HGW-Cloacimonetes-1]|jgi:hypothetical protein|nr:MAG: hypothetical protein CVU48_04440 [Candidatus Cloacimonetes bacterium HGW-Cloacimonetes-1]
MKIDSQTERRIIFIVLFIAVMLPLIFPIGWTSEVSPHVQMTYDMVDNTPEGSVVLLSFDYDPSTATELQPMAISLIEHAWKNNQRVIATALWPMGVKMADAAFQELLLKYPSKESGVDFVNLGYKTGGMVTIQAMGRDMKSVFPTDTKTIPYEDIPLLKTVRSLKDIQFVISLSAGDPGIKQWIMGAHDMFGVKVAGGTTAVSAPGFLPYINSQNQLYGLLGGLKAASEYEQLLGIVGPATVKMDSQSVAHVLILVFIAIGNVKAYKKRNSKKEGK